MPRIISAGMCLSLLRDLLKQFPPKPKGQSPARFSNAAAGGTLSFELRKPTDERIPEHLPTGIEGVFRPNRRHDHMQHRHDRRDLAPAEIVIDFATGLFDEFVGDDVANGVEDGALHSIRNLWSFSRSLVDSILTHIRVSFPMVVFANTTIGYGRPLSLTRLTDRHSELYRFLRH